MLQHLEISTEALTNPLAKNSELPLTPLWSITAKTHTRPLLKLLELKDNKTNTKSLLDLMSSANFMDATWKMVTVL